MLYSQRTVHCQHDTDIRYKWPTHLPYTNCLNMQMRIAAMLLSKLRNCVYFKRNTALNVLALSPNQSRSHELFMSKIGALYSFKYKGRANIFVYAFWSPCINQNLAFRARKNIVIKHEESNMLRCAQTCDILQILHVFNY